MQNQIDTFVSYVYRTSRKKEIRGDASIALLVQEGYEAPPGGLLTRSMVEALRKYLSEQHQVKPEQITIQNIVRLHPEVVNVPEQEGEGDGEVRHGEVGGGVPKIPPELAEAMQEHFDKGMDGSPSGEGAPAPVVGEGE